MVLHKRLEYGFSGYQVPATPRASRSARGKRLFSKKIEDNQMCAFDLLATVAGKLLLEKEISPDPHNVVPQVASVKDTIEQEQCNDRKPVKQECCNHPCYQGSCNESGFYSKATLRRRSENKSPKEFFHAEEDPPLGHTSMITKSERTEVLSFTEVIVGKNRNAFDNISSTVCGLCWDERGIHGCLESHDGKVVDEINGQLETEHQRIGIVKDKSAPNECHMEDLMEMDIEPPALVSSDSSIIEVPFCGDHICSGSLPRHQDEFRVVNRDDDEKSFGHIRHSTLSLKAFKPPCLGDRRIRKLSASKCWNASPALLKDRELSNADLEMKPIFCGRKISYTRQRTQRCYPLKKRKLLGKSSISTPNGGITSDDISYSPVRAINRQANGSACEASSPMPAQKLPFDLEDSCVKLSIKSFKVPELFIEIPETATVGSLKRTVMEAVTAILGGGLRVGVLVQGKKVRDDSKTLLQTGISCDDKLDGLGFMLEPNVAHAPQSLCLENHHLQFSCDATKTPSRPLEVPALDPVVSNDSPNSPLTTLINCIKRDHGSVMSAADMSLEKITPDSGALVAIPPMRVEALAVVPLHRKSRRPELAQRRIRRPFTVAEVEALVQAVEKLGIGRWRDVKLCAFENAKHRTYVDLKDKWKTLVHTARISPQQRRGVPVSQQLLDRVLSAHAYWAQQQAKQQQEPSRLLL